MPVRCAGFADPSGDEARPCIFGQDGLGGPAHPRGKSCCVLCSLESLERVLSSRVGKGNLQRLLKHWRQIGSPTYEAAFAFGSLCVLSPSEQYGLRRKAGEAANSKFRKKSSWLHKKQQRLEFFLKGRPIPSASPNISQSGHDFLRASSRCSQLYLTYALYRQNEPFANIKTKCQRRSYWQGRVAIVRKKCRIWWRARREIKAHTWKIAAAGPPFRVQHLKWAMEEGLLQAGTQVPLLSTAFGPRWCCLTEHQDILYFQGLDERLSFEEKQMRSAKVSMNNALGTAQYRIDDIETGNLMTEQGYDWHTHMLRKGVTFSQLFVSSALERCGFKLQQWGKHEQWPKEALGLLQIRGSVGRADKDYWAALKVIENRMYLLDVFLAKPVLVKNWHHALQIYPTYAVLPLWT